MRRLMRWGVVGTGAAAGVFARGLADAPGAHIAAVSSRSGSRAKAFAAAHGAGHARAHEGVEALARDTSVDVVYIATPASEHHAAALTMLAAGKPVVIEKPFALDAPQAREIVALARRKGLFCMEAMWMRFVPGVREFLERIRHGAVGEARTATIELGHPFDFDPTHRLFDPTLGGGALLDLGPYVVSLAVQIFGPPEHVQSRATFRQLAEGASPGRGVDEHVSALLEHQGGRQSLVAVSLRTRLSNDARVAGTDGLARLHEPLYRAERMSILPTRRWAPARAQLERPVVRRLREVTRRARALLSAGPWPRALTVTRRCRGNGYQYEAVEAMRCIRAGEVESPLMKLDETVRVMETLDAIRLGWKGT